MPPAGLHAWNGLVLKHSLLSLLAALALCISQACMVHQARASRNAVHHHVPARPFNTLSSTGCTPSIRLPLSEKQWLQAKPGPSHDQPLHSAPHSPQEHSVQIRVSAKLSCNTIQFTTGITPTCGEVMLLRWHQE